jgi:hypothetical protein
MDTDVSSSRAGGRAVEAATAGAARLRPRGPDKVPSRTGEMPAESGTDEEVHPTWVPPLTLSGPHARKPAPEGGLPARRGSV